MLGPVSAPLATGCQGHLDRPAVGTGAALRARTPAAGRVQGADASDRGATRVRERRGACGSRRFWRSRFAEEDSRGGTNRMNDKPVLDADVQAQPANPETQAQAAFETIISGARRVREALGRVIVGQSEAIDLALVTLLAGGTAVVYRDTGVGTKALR